jgi:inner membrane protein
VASVLSHPAVVLALGPLFEPLGVPPRVWLLGAACAVVPDADVIGFAAGIPYGHALGHRGLTHSLAFAAALAALLVATLFPEPAWRGARGAVFAFLFLCTASHGLLDAMTNGGLGVGFFLPFQGGRFFLPWRPIEVSPIGTARFFGRRGIEVLRSELLWIWLPSALVGGLAAALRAMIR